MGIGSGVSACDRCHRRGREGGGPEASGKPGGPAARHDRGAVAAALPVKRPAAVPGARWRGGLSRPPALPLHYQAATDRAGGRSRTASNPDRLGPVTGEGKMPPLPPDGATQALI